MGDGGQVGMRGYLVQTLIALLDTLDGERPWTSVTLEPKVESDKVDILWRYRDGTTAVQVKSSQNPFQKADVERWASELQAWKKADEYELVLVGQHGSPSVAKMRRVGNVAVPPARNLDLQAFLEQAAHRLDRFLEQNQLPVGTSSHREMLAHSLAGQLAHFSTGGRAMQRAALVKQLKEWLPSKTEEPGDERTAGRRRLNLRVFLSTPDDLAGEREALRDVIEFVNRTSGEQSGYFLKLFDLHRDVVPKIGPRRGQVIAEQTPDCDIYLGILSARFGEASGRYGSGTEEEYRAALRASSRKSIESRPVAP